MRSLLPSLSISTVFAATRWALWRRRILWGVIATMEAVLMTQTSVVSAAPLTAHDFVFENIDGGSLPLADYRGKTILVVNTASLCGFTGQYEGLQTLWQTYRDRGLVVIGVPSDDFGGQEPGTADQIKTFCTTTFGIDFPMADKVRIKGPDAHPYYKWVAQQGALKSPRWNFYKQLIDRDGNLVEWFTSTTSPTAPKLITAIEKHLAQ
jgi:glutathione peroxidase